MHGFFSRAIYGQLMIFVRFPTKIHTLIGLKATLNRFVRLLRAYLPKFGIAFEDVPLERL